MKTPVYNHLASLLTLASLAIACGEPSGNRFDPSGDFSLPNGTGNWANTMPANWDGGGMWVNNGLHEPDVSGIDPAFPLASDEGLSPEGALLGDPILRDTVTYLVECALPAGRTINKRVDGESLVFEGAVGLAPEWEDEGCDQDCQEWVSACLLARTNASGQTIPLWMRAEHPAIGEGTNPHYPIYEASFFGNLFDGTGSRYYCQGPALERSYVSRLVGRACTSEDGEPCGFVEYTDCQPQRRCEYAVHSGPGLGSKASPADCMAGPLPGKSFHTISTYVGML